MKFSRQSHIPPVDAVLSEESMRRLSMVSAYLALYTSEGVQEKPNLRVSNMLALKRMVMAAVEGERARQRALADVQRIARILEDARRKGDEVYYSYLKANEENLRAVFFDWLKTQITALTNRINPQKKALLQSYNVGDSDIKDMADEAVHEFVTRTQGKTNLMASLGAWKPEGGASILTWVLNGAAKMMDTIVGQNQKRILTQTKSLNENLQGKDGDRGTLGDLIAAPSVVQEMDDFEADQLNNIDDLMESFNQALPKRIADQPNYIKSLLDRGRKAMEARLENASDPVQEEADFNAAIQLMDKLYQDLISSFNELKAAVQAMRANETQETKKNATMAKNAYERRVQSLLRNLVEAFNPELARRKRRKTQAPVVPSVPAADLQQAPDAAVPADKKVKKPTPRAVDLLKEEEWVGHEFVTPEELAAKKAEIEALRKKLLPYYYKVGNYPDSRVGEDGKRTPYPLKLYGMGLIPPYRHFYSGLNAPEEIEALLSDHAEATASLSPMALFSRLLLEGGLKAHEEHNLERKFRIPGANIGQREAERFRQYVLDQIDTNPVYWPHRAVLLQMLENFFMNKSGKYSEEKFDEMIESLDAHTRVAAYEWARNEMAREQGVDPKPWTEMSDEELKSVSKRAWEALYPQGFRRFRVQQIDDQGNPIHKGPVMTLSRWQNPVAFQKIMEEETQNVRQMIADMEARGDRRGTRAEQRQRRKHPIAYRSRLDADTPPAYLGNAATLLQPAEPVAPEEPLSTPEGMAEEGEAVRASVAQRLLMRIAALDRKGDYAKADAAFRALEYMIQGGGGNGPASISNTFCCRQR
jgi:hypothetical protein